MKIKMIFSVLVIICFFIACNQKTNENSIQQNNLNAADSLAKLSAYNIKKGNKPSTLEIIELLKKGNERFATGKSVYPNADISRIKLANNESQGDYAIATILSCSDSRVPVEIIFDAGIMDLFIVRVAGNVADTDEIGTIEYGLKHVKTPVLVILGHSKCGAVTAVTHAVEGKGHELEYNIPPLVDNIIPAVKKVIAKNHGEKDEEIITKAIEENVWQSISDIFTRSASIRELFKGNKIKVVGAIYNLESGVIQWLDENKTSDIFIEVEKNPKKNTQLMAE